MLRMHAEKQICGASINSNVAGSCVRGKENSINHTLASKKFFSRYFANSKPYSMSNYKGWGNVSLTCKELKISK